MTSQTDSRGNETSYTYNEKRGYLTSTTNAKNISTNYTYNSSEFVTGVNVKQGNNTLSSVGYVYDSNNRLSKIQSPSGTEYSFIYDGFGRTKETKLGQSRTLSSYTYNVQGLPVTMSYGNGTSIQYGYDVFYRQNTKTINDVLRYRYTYDSASRLSEILDLALNKKTKYSYDLLGRITSEKLIDMNTHYVTDELNLRYDDAKNRLAGYDLSFENYAKSIDYVYGGEGIAPDLVTGVKLNNNSWLSYEYDQLNRLSKRTLSTTTPFVTQYSYLAGENASKTTALVEYVTNGMDDENLYNECTLKYEYDVLGNITNISYGVLVNGEFTDVTYQDYYTYDSLNQLTNATIRWNTYSYTYDEGGNITSKTENGVTKTYAYEDPEWKDLLTKYDGNTITYDNIGNPLSYHDGSTFTWSDGRRLTGITNGNNVYTYVYDEGGQRVSKTVNGVTTNYHWLDGKLQAEETDTYMLVYHYDENGMLVGFTYKTGATEANYYYVHNLQGDVIGIIDSTGTTVVEYVYDAWGKLLEMTGSLANTIGALNPFRYRDYYYDAETAFYYCISRYYDPEICRWINADSQLNTSLGVLGVNQFSYCLNIPVNMVDYGGNKPGDLFDTMDEAARDFAEYINAKSIEDNREYASYIYTKTITETRTITYINPIILGNNLLSWLWNVFFGSNLTQTVTIKVKVTKYTYREPKRGTVDSSSPPINWFDTHTVVGRLHTHAAYDPAYANDIFSPADKRNAERQGVPTYVATPLGTLRKYDPSNGTDVVLFNDLPFDPNHPGR